MSDLLRCARLATFAVTILVPGAAFAETPWWKTFTLEPRGTHLLGIPVDRVNREWIRATALESSMLTSAQRDDLSRRNRHFVANGDFNDDSRADRALVGVYENKQGKRGSFVAVFTQRDDRSWQAVYSEVGDEPGQFSVLHQSADKPFHVFWSPCLDCAAPTSVTWSGINFFLQYVDEPRAN
jgi:hypothetical protein